MEMKTNVAADEGKQDILITRAFDLPVEMLFKAYEDAELLAQWMGTKVVRLESRKHGSYQFETRDKNGNVVFAAEGVIHEFITNEKIIRTFEMHNSSFGVQLEVYEFIKVSEEKSQLAMHVVYESNAMRDQLLKLPFSYGINMAHNKLEEILKKEK